ncbi:MAG: thrombospondin, partial [Micromonospora sp.]
TDGERAADAERRAAAGAGATVEPDSPLERTVDLDRNRTVERPVDREHVDPDGRTEPAVPVAVGPKPRASLLATLGLIVSVVGALFVLSGTLAGYGVGLGAVGAVLAVLGLIATRRRHVAGKADAVLGILVGLAAVVLGIVALTGQFPWPTTDGDWVGRFREWLDSQFDRVL